MAINWSLVSPLFDGSGNVEPIGMLNALYSFGTYTVSFEGSGAGGVYLSKGLVLSRRNGVGATSTDATDVRILRDASATTGGQAGFANAALDVNSTAGAGSSSFEWNFRATLDNFGKVGTENVSGYLIARKRGPGATIGAVVEIADYTKNPTTTAGALEVDVSAIGADNNNARYGIHIAGRRPGDSADTDAVLAFAMLYVSTENYFTFKHLLHPGKPGVPAIFGDGLNFEDASFTSGKWAVVKRGDLLALEATSSITFGLVNPTASVVGLQKFGVEKIGFDVDDGRILINGVPVVSARQSAIANPTDASSTQAAVISILNAMRGHGLIAT